MGRVVRCCIVGGPTRAGYEVALQFDESVAPVLSGDLAVVGSPDIDDTTLDGFTRCSRISERTR
jgi:hypothetical protein